MIIKNFRAASYLILIALLAACSKVDIKREFPKTRQQKEEDRIGKLTGDGLVFGKGASDSPSSANYANVNAYLWRASLDQVDFMPLNSADSSGGVIVTDWYSISDSSKERYKLNVYILGKDLSANSIKVNVYKQTLGKNLIWNNQRSDENLAEKIKNKIIDRARQLKVTGLIKN
ncbi:hypothetical protein TRIADDRAFT_63005 [Trichoplax adhaerens]|uniref:DUF3576 domain-containing protein n=1 Tax=Trichoplax adhaerens TaxID=10228 RepID=B3SFL6_TRIAD|nr:hypothetical protein TRIADDRAFT_63005 [Trichoplax adhaerens]EDV18479.1 hypothetical protein TRIADDRAFT_63005 [Trichoplax adhaerens]|eukprot:XP_002119035.1 hypothetical protein TRIADDRAFT_63005 [Trichoplax adhaerens]